MVENEYVNIYNLNLEHGKRYHVCIHANSTTQTFEKWEGILPEVSSCSDGVVIDITPPNPGQVWIGWDTHIQYQVQKLLVNLNSLFRFIAIITPGTFLV